MPPQGMPMDPNQQMPPQGGPPMDPAMAGGAMSPQGAPPAPMPAEDLGPVVEQMMGALEQIGQAMEAMDAQFQEQYARTAQLEEALQGMGSQMEQLMAALQGPAPAGPGAQMMG